MAPNNYENIILIAQRKPPKSPFGPAGPVMDNTSLKYIVSGTSSAAFVGGLPAASSAATTFYERQCVRCILVRRTRDRRSGTHRECFATVRVGQVF